MTSGIKGFVPQYFTSIQSAANRAIYGNTIFSGKQWGQAALIVAAIEVGIAAGICFAAYKGSVLAAGALAVTSTPATMVALGAMAAKHGYTLIKAGVAAHKISQVALGGLALVGSWLAFDNFNTVGKRTGFWGFLTNPIWELSKAITGYKE